MRRYWLFAGDQYYPRGGMMDFILDDDSITAIVGRIVWENIPTMDSTMFGGYSGVMFRKGEGVSEGCAITLTVDGSGDDFSWYQIFDSNERKIIEAYSSYGRGKFDNLGGESCDSPREFFEDGRFNR